MSLSRDPLHPVDRLEHEETPEARRRRERKQDQDAAGLVAEETRNERLAEQSQAFQRKLWGDRASLSLEVNDEFSSRRLFR